MEVVRQRDSGAFPAGRQRPILGTVRALLLAGLALTSAAAAQTGVVWGAVTDADTGDPLPGAWVRAGEALGAVAGTEGLYRVEGVPTGALVVQGSFPGYQTVTVETALAGDSLRLDLALQAECFGLDALSIVVYPRGEVMDLPALGPDAWFLRHVPGRRTRYVETVAPEPLATRAARTLVWDRAADAAGRWRPARAGLGMPQTYVNGLPALSLDALPVDATVIVGAHGGYLPAAFGGEAAGAAVAVAEGDDWRRDGLSARESFATATASGASGSVRADAHRSRRAASGCRQLVDHSSAFGEGAAAAEDGGVRLDGRAFAEHVVRPLHLQSHARLSGDTGAEVASFGGVAQLGGSTDALLIVGGDVDVRPGATTGLLAVRAEGSGDVPKRGRPFVRVGVEASARSVAEDAPALAPWAGRSAVAVYGEVRRDGDVGAVRDASVTAGLRAERFWPEGRPGVWTVQPRALAELEWGRGTGYAYGTVASAPDPDGRLRQRAEAGMGGQWNAREWSSPVTVGAHGYVRSVTGAVRGRVYGLDSEVAVAAHSASLSLRARTERGNARLARDRATAALAVTVGEYGPLRWLGGGHRAYVDVSEGVGRRRVVEVGGEWTPWWLGGAGRWLGLGRALSFHGRGVVAGYEAVPCSDGFSDGAAVGACPAPTAEVAVRVVW